MNAFSDAMYRFCRWKRKKQQQQHPYDKQQQRNFAVFHQQISSVEGMIQSSKEEIRTLVKSQYDNKKPASWTDSNSSEILVHITPYEDEYWTVTHQLQRDMPDAYISRLWRVQNHSLWAFHMFRKDRFVVNYDMEHNETWVWHGTSFHDPDVIYNDHQDGFPMRLLAQMGLWGRGIYFASRSSYSHYYSYRPHGEDWQATFMDRPIGQEDEHELFLAKLLVGRATHLEDPCTSLIVPPEDPDRPGQRFHTVVAETRGSTVFVVYENGRAYPAYLVRYYRGERDPKRTPFETRDEAYQWDDDLRKQSNLCSWTRSVHDSSTEIMATSTTASSTNDDDIESGLPKKSSCKTVPKQQDLDPHFNTPPYPGRTRRTAYLPNNEEGRRFLMRLLKHAFRRGLTFTKGIWTRRLDHKTTQSGSATCNAQLDAQQQQQHHKDVIPYKDPQKVLRPPPLQSISEKNNNPKPITSHAIGKYEENVVESVLLKSLKEHQWDRTLPFWHLIQQDEQKAMALTYGFETIGEFEEFMREQRALVVSARTPTTTIPTTTTTPPNPSSTDSVEVASGAAAVSDQNHVPATSSTNAPPDLVTPISSL